MSRVCWSWKEIPNTTTPVAASTSHRPLRRSTSDHDTALNNDTKMTNSNVILKHKYNASSRINTLPSISDQDERIPQRPTISVTTETIHQKSYISSLISSDNSTVPSKPLINVNKKSPPISVHHAINTNQKPSEDKSETPISNKKTMLDLCPEDRLKIAQLVGFKIL